jgi:predicted CxxxxCH...CXXCH cytochrome family protein
VTFGGLALARVAEPSFDPETRRCAGVACHGAGLGSGRDAQPRWRDVSAGATQCGSCHAVPPPPPHSEDDGCQAVICHGGEITPSASGPGISLAGRLLHVDGVVNVGGR